MNFVKRVCTIFGVFILSFSLVACGSGNKNATSDTKKTIEYIDDSKLNSLYTEPKKFKNKGVKLMGRIFSVEEDGDDNYLQVFVEVSGDEKNTIVKDLVSKEKFKENEIVYIEGIVTDEFKGENAFGAEVLAPAIEATKVEKKSFMEAYRPTIKELSVSESKEQNNIKITIEKIELAEKETRVYLKVKNDSDNKFNLYTHTAKIIQDGKQFEEEYIFEDDYKEIQTDISPGVETDGIILFPKIEEGAFQFNIEGSSDDYNIDFNPFSFEVNM